MCPRGWNEVSLERCRKGRSSQYFMYVFLSEQLKFQNELEKHKTQFSVKKTLALGFSLASLLRNTALPLIMLNPIV